VLEEQWTNGALSATTGYVYGDALISRTTNGTPHYYLYDGMGSTRTLTDMTGAVTDTYQYDAYGNLLDKTGSTINPYRYRGEQYDADLSAYYLRARYYQPGIGRFLTTDPVEGFPNSPISLHRYVYGNDDPINFLDPSGEKSYTEMVTTAGIILNLAVAAISPFSETLQDIYADFARDIFPEAYIVGFNAIGTVPFPFTVAVEEIFYDIAWPISFPTYDSSPLIQAPYLHATIGRGREFLLSIGSGEVALFDTRSLGGVLTLPTLSFGLELYDGFVYNLWNASDYHGPFESISLNFGKHTGLSLFWDGPRGFKGPWGGASTFFSKSLGLKLPWNYALGRTHTDYAMVGKPEEFDRAEVVKWICKIILVTKTIEAINKHSVTPAAFSALEMSIWINISLAHNYWNKQEPEYNIDERRRKIARPDGYRSGPSYWLF
jgi:RHS repeat-associated protein